MIGYNLRLLGAALLTAGERANSSRTPADVVLSNPVFLLHILNSYHSGSLVFSAKMSCIVSDTIFLICM